MGEQTWRDVIGDVDLPDALPELFDELEQSGWLARSRWGDTSIRFWPDGARGRQITIDLRYPINEPRLALIREAIAAHTLATQVEGDGGTR